MCRGLHGAQMRIQRPGRVVLGVSETGAPGDGRHRVRGGHRRVAHHPSVIVAVPESPSKTTADTRAACDGLRRRT